MTAPAVTLVPISQIHVLNPRSRNKVVFSGHRGEHLSPGPEETDHRGKARGCGAMENAMHSCVAKGGSRSVYRTRPNGDSPIVTEASREECFLMSLVENIARRHHTPTELLREISTLKARGLQHGRYRQENRRGTQLHQRHYAAAREREEDRLLAGVERGRVPLSVAIEIAGADEVGIQRACAPHMRSKTLRRVRSCTRFAGSLSSARPTGSQRDRRKSPAARPPLMR
jgi:ParB family chromosome partitioning protein